MFSHLNKFEQAMLMLHPYNIKTTFAVALSGGVDSLALLILCNIWSKKYMHDIVALTVDHALRSSSTDDATQVNQQCMDLNIKHHILKWCHDGIDSNIQSQARQARYKLLTEYCKQNNIIYLLTAHHLDDVIENFFIRLSDGSGSLGLSMQNKHYINNVCVLKPMLNFYKNDCIEIVSANNLVVIQDPSNAETIYFRNEIRQKLNSFLDCKNLSSELFKNRISTSISHLNSSSKILNNLFVKALVNSSIIYQGGYAQIDLNIFINYAEDNQFLLLSHLLTLISGKNYIPRHSNIINLMHSIFKQDTKKDITQFTLHNCLIIIIGNILTICYNINEKKHNKKPSYKLEENRFILNFIAPSCIKGLFLDQLTTGDYHYLRKETTKPEQYLEQLPLLLKTQYDKILRKKILFTLPVIKTIEKLLAIPHINYYSADAYELGLNKILKLQFKPSFISKLTHYS